MTVVISGNTGISGTNGSAGTPAVQGEDTNTGIFFPAADTVAVATGGTERARINASGYLLVGTTTSSPHDALISIDNTSNTLNRSKLAVTGFGASRGYGIVFQPAINTSATPALFLNAAGSEVGSISTSSGTSTAYVTSSDYRLKENVQPMQNALDTIAQLNPVTYTWKADGSAGQGFIAHELQAVVPDCVTGEKDAVDAEGNPQYQGVDTSFLVATLVAALQEAHGLIADLTARIAILEAK